MTIHPTSGGPSRPDPSRLQGTKESAQPAERGASGSGSPAAPPADGVEVSDAARALQSRAGVDQPPAGEVSAERMRQVTRRIAEGYYDRPEVERQVAERILDALERGDS